MEIKRKHSNARNRLVVLIVAVIACGFGCAEEPKVPGYSTKVVDPYQSRRWSSATFTTAHPTYTDAAKHFLDIKSKPVQPIDFPHQIHTIDIGTGCDFCHEGVTTGAVAGIPSISVCMTCHDDIGDECSDRIQKLRDFAKRGEDVPWQRVYGFLEEAHVRFNHAPHVRVGVECATCHGDLTQMNVAERVVDHTMLFCINCHKEKQTSNDCLVCHY